jgi:hypothetical protein
MDFLMQLPAEMLLDVIEQRQRDIRDQVAAAAHRAATRPRRETPAGRAVGRLRRLIAASVLGR